MKNRILVLSFALAVGLSGVAVESPRVIGHRGNYQYDDNAVGGFKQSLAAGITGFELDVHATKDGEMIVMHDSSVTRTTTSRGCVEEMTLNEVTNLVLKKSGEHVPTLQQVVDVFVNRADVLVEIEMKATGKHTGDVLNNYVDKTYDIVTKTMKPGTYAFTSFSTAYLKAMKERHPTAPIGLIVGSALTQKQIDTAHKLGCVRVAPTAATTKEMVMAAKAVGLKTTLWMVEDLNAWKASKEKGADATTSNHPISLYKAVKAL